MESIRPIPSAVCACACGTIASGPSSAAIGPASCPFAEAAHWRRIARFRKRRSGTAAPLPPGPPCAWCGTATHARSQRDDDGRPVHLECTGLYVPSVIDEPVAADDDGLAARVRAVVICSPCTRKDTP